MSPQVSVIVPIFNTAPFIARCCESLFGQTLESIQIIFVDDASTDGSLGIVHQILNRYPHRQPQVVFYKFLEHRGVGAARQKGLELATGDYVIHCDSDDWVELTTYDRLYKYAVDNHSDIVTFGYCIDNCKGETIRTIPAVTQSEKASFSIGPQIGSLWSKLISRMYILENNLKVPTDINWGEDLCFSLSALLLTQRIHSLNEPLYHYVQHGESLTHNITTTKCLDLIQCGTKIEQFLTERHLLEDYQHQLNWLKFQLKQYFLIFPETRAISSWRTIYPESNRHLLSYSASWYLKLSSWLIVHQMPFLASLLLRLKDTIAPRRQACV